MEDFFCSQSIYFNDFTILLNYVLVQKSWGILLVKICFSFLKLKKQKKVPMTT